MIRMNLDMRMIPFHERFPQVAEKELRILLIPGDNKYGLPAGAYALLESFVTCRSRNVIAGGYS
ncbi:MAG: hypothetical protein ACP5OC_06975 [Thermoplasmata archaeon]